MTRDTETPLRVLDHSGEDLYVLPYAYDPAPFANLRPHYLHRPEFEWKFTEPTDFFVELLPYRGWCGRFQKLRRWWSRWFTARPINPVFGSANRPQWFDLFVETMELLDRP